MVYLKVASEHKGEERLDKDPEQWAKVGQPTPFEQFLPRRFQQPGFVRHTRLTPLAFHDLCVPHQVANETQLWAKATELSEQGDHGLHALQQSPISIQPLLGRRSYRSTSVDPAVEGAGSMLSPWGTPGS